MTHATLWLKRTEKKIKLNKPEKQRLERQLLFAAVEASADIVWGFVWHWPLSS